MRCWFQVLAAAVVYSQTVGAADLPLRQQPKPSAQSIINFCSEVPAFAKLAERAIFYLEPGAFEPSQVGRGYKSPVIGAPLNSNSPEWNNLKAGYDAASDPVKKQLCGLKYIFVTRAQSYPWGFWESTAQVPTDTREKRGGFIAIPSQQLITPGTLSSNEGSTLVRLTGKDFDNPPAWPNPPTISASPDTQALAVLAVLTHELGHVLFLDRASDPNGNKCFDTVFVGSSWKKSPNQPRRPWIKFGEEGGWEHADNTTVPTPADIAPALSEIRTYTEEKKWDDARDRVMHVFLKRQGKAQRGHYVSLFAAVSAEEDFIETYKFAALKAAQPDALKKLTLSIHNASNDEIDLMAMFNSHGLAQRKQRCLSRLGIEP